MALDFGIYIGKAEDFLRRHLKSKAVQEAEKRRGRRKMREIGRRFNRALGVAAVSGAGIVGYGAMVAPLGMTALAASGAAALIATGAALFWPSSRRQRGISREELVALVADAEEWLLAQRALLPGKALPTFDQLFARLHDLHGCAARIDPTSTWAWELRRLLGDHLPRLVQSYVELPATVKDAEPQLLQRLIAGLVTVDEELVQLCREASRDNLVTFEAQGRFIETRYKDGDELKGA